MKLASTRLTLHPVSVSELQVFHDLLTDPFIRKYLCDDQVFSVERSRDFILESQQTFKERRLGLWLLRNTEQTVIGFAGLKSFFEESQPQLLYALLPDYTGQGLALEAAAAIVRYCFEELGFDYLEASCDIPNLPSQRVAERIGMRKVEERTVDDKSLAFYRIENEKRGK